MQRWKTADSHLDKRALRATVLNSLLSAREIANGSKDSVRAAHRGQRRLKRVHEDIWLQANESTYRPAFAKSSDIDPTAIVPRLVEVEPGTREAAVFRAATIFWSVPVSRGFGRRMRFLVEDATNGKLIGLFALGDPVFNLSTRDRWIGWDVEARKARIASVMDLYVCGAVPPYSALLGGKLVASLATSQEVADRFAEKYKGRAGVISGETKPARLLVLTTTSALGRSSLYNRLHLNIEPSVSFERLGATKGWGHFQISDEIFLELRNLLTKEQHAYANGHFFGSGPNWRLRTIRAALDSLGIAQNLLEHGIQREVYAAELVPTARKQLREHISQRRVQRPSAAVISAAAVSRWISPRIVRLGIPRWTAADIDRAFAGDSD